jgi:hypothetical protein
MFHDPGRATARAVALIRELLSPPLAAAKAVQTVAGGAGPNGGLS